MHRWVAINPMIIAAVNVYITLQPVLWRANPAIAPESAPRHSWFTGFKFINSTKVSITTLQAAMLVTIMAETARFVAPSAGMLA